MTERDRLDELIDQWKKERPDLAPEVMASVGRIGAVARLIGSRLGEAAAGHGLDTGQGDVLFTLRRAGKPYRLAPSVLVASLLVTSGTMTNRLDRLEGMGLIERIPNPEDRRGMDVQLTQKGLTLVDELIPEHLENEEEILAPLDPSDRKQLDRIMRQLLAGLERE